jgi:hypothetical protein
MNIKFSNILVIRMHCVYMLVYIVMILRNIPVNDFAGNWIFILLIIEFDTNKIIYIIIYLKN